MKQARWKEVHVGGKKKDKCVGSGNVKEWKRKNVRELSRDKPTKAH